MPTQNDRPEASGRLHDLEERFTALGAAMPDSPQKQAFSLLHAMLQEMRREIGRGFAGPELKLGAHDAARGDSSLETVATLYRHAPKMEAPARRKGLVPGTKAPDFALPDAHGRTIRLSDHRGAPLVLVFYPLDWSPGCSVQLDLYSQDLDQFAARGARVVAISVDSLYSHGAWAAVRGIRFPLLADFNPKGQVAGRYDVYRDEDGFSERALFVIDGNGIIQYSYVSPYLHHVPDIHDLFTALDRLDEVQHRTSEPVGAAKE